MDKFMNKVSGGSSYMVPADGMEGAHGPTWEQQQNLAADKQTAEHLWNTEQYEEVCVHIGSVYGLSREEASVKPADSTWKQHAERCMKELGV